VSSFDSFQEQLNGGTNLPFHKTRKIAISELAELGFPAQKNEDWKYTNVAQIVGRKFRFLSDNKTLQKADVKPFLFEELKETVLVFVNGHFSEELSTLNIDSQGVVVDNLKNAMEKHLDIVDKYLAKYVPIAGNSFAALNTAFTADGAFVYVPRNCKLEEVIHIIYITDAEEVDGMSQPRNLFVVADGAQAHIIESFHSVSTTTYFNNLVTEVYVGANAHLDHLKLQDENPSAYHVSNSQVHQERDSVYTTVNLDLGAKLVRNNLNIRLNGVNGEAHIFGYYMGSGDQHIDNQTFIDHAVPNCFSNELYKGILDDRARGVFNGKILVRPDAQKTNALQSNKTLLLTNDAEVDVKPQLEIFADDVKCTHGATIGQLDDEALFYLRARGISEEMASAMLRHAFVADVLENIKVESIREHMDERIIARFANKDKK
jgi:Fe-S cluster assembly protein SufD